MSSTADFQSTLELRTLEAVRRWQESAKRHDRCMVENAGGPGIHSVLKHSDQSERSIFTPENLLREARRQKAIAKRRIPGICILDPDGDIVRYLRKKNQARLNRNWACYHTELYNARLSIGAIGIVGCAVGAPYAVLVAEEMFASGCSLLLSITSAGRVRLPVDSPRFLLISRALRDEGTSDRYTPPAAYSYMRAKLLTTLRASIAGAPFPLGIGTSWTTDAPFRETAKAVSHARDRGVACVEMEAAALYAFGKARKRDVVCLAHVTNSMAQSPVDFEKGAENGSIDSLTLIDFLVRALRKDRTRRPRRAKLSPLSNHSPP
jgi:uridine phosphorylase